MITLTNFNSRKAFKTTALIIIAILIILKFLQLSKICQTATVGVDIRVWGTIFERPVVKNNAVIVNFQQFQFTFTDFPDKELIKFLKLPGKRVEISGKINSIEKISLLKTQLQDEKRIKNEEKWDSYYNSTASQSFNTLTRAVIPVYGCEISLIGQSIELDSMRGYLGYSLLSGFLLKITQMQERIVETFSSRMPEPHGSLALGMLLGVNPKMSQQFKDELVATGLLHVVAASGYNISIISSVFLSFLGSFLRKKQALIGAGLTILVYVFLAGMSPSIIRAGIMGVFSLWATSSGRLYRAQWAIVQTVLLMLWWSPLLLFSASFQLSISATVGIICLLPRLQPKWLTQPPSQNESFIVKIIRFLSESFLTTTAATLMTMPVIMIRFGRVSVISFLANTALVALVPWIMALAGFFLVTASILPPLSNLAIFPLWSVTQIFIIGVRWFAKVPFAQFEVHNVSEWWIAVWWGAVAVFLQFTNPKKKPPDD